MESHILTLAMRLSRCASRVRSSCSWLIFLGCAGDLVEDVPAEVCASGKRWVGELTASEEMFPGRDCVGCHMNEGGPELLAGGTVYGLVDRQGTRTVLNDCFGVEGARVTITTGDGQRLETLTNRAGNFYFEGRESSLVTPLRVVVEYEFDDGRRSRQEMASSPSYGGCARCHRTDTTPTVGAGPGEELGRDEVVANPFVLPIFTGPVHE
jgi:hypothetical protein